MLHKCVEAIRSIDPPGSFCRFLKNGEHLNSTNIHSVRAACVGLTFSVGPLLLRSRGWRTIQITTHGNVSVGELLACSYPLGPELGCA